MARMIEFHKKITGMDSFGPLTVKIGRSSEKRLVGIVHLYDY